MKGYVGLSVLVVLVGVGSTVRGEVPKGGKSPPSGKSKTAPDRSTTSKPTDRSTTSKSTTRPTLSTQQQQNLTKLKTDLQALQGKSEVTTAQKNAVKQDLQKILSGACKPSQQSVQTLANDLSKAVADGTISTSEATKLVHDVTVVLNEANVSQQDVQKLLADVQTLLKATNLSRSDAQTIYDDVKAITTTARQNAQTAKGTKTRTKTKPKR